LAAIAAVTPAWLLVVAATDLFPNSAGMWLPAHLACFAGGMALAVLRIVGRHWRADVALLLAGVLFLIVATPLGGAIVGPVPVWAPATKAVLYAAIATLTVGALVLGTSDRYARMLGNTPMVRLGEISYEIFLLHAAVMAVTMNLLLRWPLFSGSLTVLYATTLALTIPLAWALHRVTGPRPARTLNQLA
jgi:peptidoglycan/LPS O-acetylase OafA/YrhL